MDEIRWEFYPRVAVQEHAREWIRFLSKMQKAPKTIDAYARCLDDLIGFFEQANLPLIEASRGDVAAYLDDLHHRANPKGRGNTRTQAGGLSHATIQQRLTAARLWYEHLTYHKIRQDQVKSGWTGNVCSEWELAWEARERLPPSPEFLGWSTCRGGDECDIRWRGCIERAQFSSGGPRVNRG